MIPRVISTWMVVAANAGSLLIPWRPTIRRRLEGILAIGEEHADDLVSLLQKMGEK
jgi:hypothetical protein